MSGLYLVSFVCTSRKYVQAVDDHVGFVVEVQHRQRLHLRAGHAPLCAIGVAIAIAFAQLWPGRPGMLDGKRSVTVGTFHDTSPMSSTAATGAVVGPGPLNGVVGCGREPVRPAAAELASGAPGRALILFTPLGHADQLDVARTSLRRSAC